MKNFSEAKTPNNKEKKQKNINISKTKEEENSLTKNSNKKSFRTNPYSKNIKYRNKNNDEFLSNTQIDKEESKKTNYSLMFLKSKDKNKKYSNYKKNSNNIRDIIKKEYSLCQKEIKTLKGKEEELKLLKDQLKLKKENYNIYINNNIRLNNPINQTKNRKNKNDKDSKKLSHKTSLIKNGKKNRNNYSMIEGLNSGYKKINSIKINKSHNFHSNNKSKSNDKTKHSYKAINKINTYKHNTSNSAEIKDVEYKHRLFLKNPKKHVIISLNKYYQYPGSTKNDNKAFINSNKKIQNNSKNKNRVISGKRNKSALNNSSIIQDNKSNTYNSFMNPKSKKEEKPKKNSEKKIKIVKENEEKKNISNDNDIITKNIQKIGIITKAGEEDSGEEKINQDNYFNYDLCHGYKFIGVCDGHGEDGQNVSEYLRNTLPQELDKELNKLISSENKRLSILESMLQKKRNELSNTEIKKEKKDEINLIENLEIYEKINELLKRVFLTTNIKLIEENCMFNLENSGSTCVSIFLQKDKINKIYIANVGDSRSIIIKEPSKDKKNNNESSWTYIQLSRDHTPLEKDEADRILKHGGEIQQLQNEAGEWEGPFRIYMKDEEGPGLAMSRSFGDVIGSILGVIAEPEVKEYKVEKEDKAIIIASDGLWEYVTNEEVTDIVKNLIYKKDPNLIVNELYKFSYERWKIKDTGIDDTTIICVLLN